MSDFWRFANRMFRGIMMPVFLAAGSWAATMTVVNTNDAGAGSLRNAITSASPGDTINFNLTYPAAITLTSGGLSISQNLTISGPGSSNLTISGNSAFTVVSIAAGANVTISGVAMANGSTRGIGGGGIYNNGTLTIISCSVSGNSAISPAAASGGGIYNSAILTIINSSISGNSAITSTGVVPPSYGGGIYNSGVLAVSNSTLSGNTSLSNGAGIYNSGSLTVTSSMLSGNSVNGTFSASGAGIDNEATLVLSNSTLVGNLCSAGGSASGGGVYNGGTATIADSTLSGNSCHFGPASGGGIYNHATLTLTNDTISSNSVGQDGTPGSGANIYNDASGTLATKGTILANSAQNCFLVPGAYAASDGYNLSDDTSCSGFLNNTGDLNNTPAGLDPNGLQNNGGPNQTIALLPGSPAVDAIPVGANGRCAAADGVTAVVTDQRSVSRPQGSACDIGAFELTSATAVLTIAKYPITGIALGQQGGAYNIAVSNSSTAGPASGTVTVSDALPSGLSLVSMAGTGWSCASTTCSRSDALAAGGSYQPITVTANVAGNAVSPLVNTATVSGGNSATAIASTFSLITGDPILSITGTHTGNFTLAQQGATYTLTVSNAAAAAPTSGTVSVTDTLPSGLTLTSMAGTGWSCAGNTCTRSDPLSAGGTFQPITVTLNVAAHATSPQINVATVSGGGWATAAASDYTFITGVPVLSISGTHSGNFTLGQQGATYTLTVSNAASAGPTSGTVLVSDNLPSGLTLVSMGGTGWSCAGNTCSRSDPLAAGLSYQPITVTVNVAAQATSPQFNNAIVSGGGAATVGASDSTTIIGTSVLALRKFHTGSFAVGQQGATYTLVVSNAATAGPTSGMVTVTDMVPGLLTLVSMAGTGWSCTGNTCSRSDPLAAGLSYPPITVTVNVAVNATSPQVNSATVSGGSSPTASASDSTSIVFPNLSIAKTHAGNFTQGQQAATYSISVFNAVAATATAGTVAVAEAIPNGETLVSMAGTGWFCASGVCTRNDPLEPGGSYPPITVTVNVSPAAPPLVTNVAMVTGGGSPAASANDPTNISSPSFVINGSVTLGGSGLSGVTVSLNGPFSSSAFTDASGSFSFSGLPAGAYTLWASRLGYSFSGPFTFSNLSANQNVSIAGIAVTGLEFYPVTPCRLVDTRVAAFQAGFGPPSMAAGMTRPFSIPSNAACGIPLTAAAYSLNVTAVTHGYLGYLSIWPAGQPIPNVSTLNSYSTNSTAVANAAIVPAGTGGAINVFVTDTTDLVLDIDGYFAPPAANGLEFYPVPPCRLVDTRVASFQSGFGPPSMIAGATRTFSIPDDTACVDSHNCGGIFAECDRDTAADAGNSEHMAGWQSAAERIDPERLQCWNGGRKCRHRTGWDRRRNQCFRDRCDRPGDRHQRLLCAAGSEWIEAVSNDAVPGRGHARSRRLYGAIWSTVDGRGDGQVLPGAVESMRHSARGGSLFVQLHGGAASAATGNLHHLADGAVPAECIHDELVQRLGSIECRHCVGGNQWRDQHLRHRCD